MRLAAACRFLGPLGSTVKLCGAAPRPRTLPGLALRRTVSVPAPSLTAPASSSALRMRSVAALSVVLRLVPVGVTAALSMRAGAVTRAMTFAGSLTGAVSAGRSVTAAMAMTAAVAMPAGMRRAARVSSVRAGIVATGRVGGGVSAGRLFAPPLAVEGRPGGVVVMPVSQGF